MLPLSAGDLLWGISLKDIIHDDARSRLPRVTLLAGNLVDALLSKKWSRRSERPEHAGWITCGEMNASTVDRDSRP